MIIFFRVPKIPSQHKSLRNARVLRSEENNRVSRIAEDQRLGEKLLAISCLKLAARWDDLSFPSPLESCYARSMLSNILMLEAPGSSLATLRQAFSEAVGVGCLIHTVASAREMMDSLRAGLAYHLVIIDADRGDGQRQGHEILTEARAFDHGLPLIAVAEKGDVRAASEAVAAGATDFLVRGPRLSDRVSTLLGKVRQLVHLIERKQALEEQNVRLHQEMREQYHMVGESPQIRTLIDRIQRVAMIPRPVLIEGERGTGKELVARAIHDAAGNGKRPMVAVNCAAFSDALLESELFGHEKGAFTGADSLVRGKFELANGGTLFLDEIGCMSLPFQQKILRTVEYGVLVRVGGSEEVHTNARVLAATNADLASKMAAGEFLRDLYDRLAFEVIEVPPLRDREGDIEVLAMHFLNRFMREIPSLRGKQLSVAALGALGRYAFPGNVREMKNIIERAAYRDTTNEITPGDLGLPNSSISGEVPGGFEARVEGFKRSLICDALDQAAGNQAKAARSLGLSYHQFRYFHRKYR